ncbi:LLM class flavin-dependent oxidoreductase [Methylobrevis pamukkalensis]|uniref:Nitrilotriacetate monooxygenase component A n=1 Tax=Methylobrevis pamukkalensis TaxID=1439726 RepID=A0A1E3H8D7_9HYPH|nr:LLM class flavin-dependent oxidoreductase [Methylobrevis pamukkalensis]ODN71761.1 Nitrilotriacetate monooxygenase component A [Methylobrevis pamukkalensis]
MASTKMMHLGAFALASGHHVAGWRLPGAQAGSENLELLKHIAMTAERGKFDLFFLADALNTSPTMHPSMVVRLEPLTLLSVLSTVTSRIGLAATASTTYSEPYNLARLFASLDHLSGGRAAWNIVAGAFPAAAANFSLKEHPEHSERYRIAAEFVEVAKGLWNSWEDDAVVMDKDSGVYVDAAKMHVLDHHGAHFNVKGPLNISRPPQGYPVFIQAGASDTGRDLAASVAEIVFAVLQDLDTAKAFADDLRGRVRKFGRNVDHLKIMPGVCPIVGESEKDARAKLAELGARADAATSLRVLSERMGHDLSAFDLDAPMPQLPPSGMMQGHAVTLAALAARDGLTLRELRDFTSAAMGHRLLLGTPEQIADGLEEWFVAGAADGFNVMPPWFPGALDDFVDHVVPVLQKRGLFRTEYEGTTLRDHLGLPRPAHPAAAVAATNAAE